MEHNLYEVIEGENIFKLSENKAEPLIEGMLHENDYVLLVAEEKIGKTIFSQQLALSLTMGKSFLGIFDIPKPLKVWYIATEGKTEDLKDRFIRMRQQVESDSSNLKLIPTAFRFNTETGIKCLKELIDRYKDNYPKVIIIDCLYPAIKGSLIKDDVVGEFNHVIRFLNRVLDCAVILIHHMKKPQRNQSDGKIMERTDKDTYGSALLLAAVDHLFRLEKWTKNPDCKKDILLRCDTQRGGNVINNIRLRLIEPEPLFFEVVSKHQKEREMITNLLKSAKEGMDMTTLAVRSRVSRSLCYIIIKELQNERKVVKIGTKNKMYKIV